MKNKIVAFTLITILSLSSTAFALNLTFPTTLPSNLDLKSIFPGTLPSTSPSTPSTSPTSSNYEDRVAELVNAERAKNGLNALYLDNSISNVARTKSKDMADNNYFSHQSPTYGTAGDMLLKFGITWSVWGENIASGQNTPEQVVNEWMNSASHRENILSPNFTFIGVGYCTNSNGTPYWTQMFTSDEK